MIIMINENRKNHVDIDIFPRMEEIWTSWVFGWIFDGFGMIDLWLFVFIIEGCQIHCGGGELEKKEVVECDWFGATEEEECLENLRVSYDTILQSLG